MLSQYFDNNYINKKLYIVNVFIQCRGKNFCHFKKEEQNLENFSELIYREKGMLADSTGLPIQLVLGQESATWF